MRVFSLPNAEGFYWAKWRIADEGTDACRKCGHRASNWEESEGLAMEGWAPVEVVENSLDEDDAEHFMVQVGGVSKWQSLLNFVWGPAIPMPEELK